MPEFTYAKGRVAESIQYLSEEIKEFESEYANKTWKDYQNDKKLQKLMDRTVENVLTALIEVCGTILAEEGIGVDSYSDALKKSAKLLGFSETDQDVLSRLAIQRNRLAHSTTTLNSFKKDHKARITGLELGLETSLNFAEKLKHLKILGFHFLLNVVVIDT